MAQTIGSQLLLFVRICKKMFMLAVTGLKVFFLGLILSEAGWKHRLVLKGPALKGSINKFRLLVAMLIIEGAFCQFLIYINCQIKKWGALGWAQDLEKHSTLKMLIIYFPSEYNMLTSTNMFIKFILNCFKVLLVKIGEFIICICWLLK